MDLTPVEERLYVLLVNAAVRAHRGGTRYRVSYGAEQEGGRMSEIEPSVITITMRSAPDGTVERMDADSWPPVIRIDEKLLHDIHQGECAPWVSPMIRASDGRHGIEFNLSNGHCVYLHHWWEPERESVVFVAEEAEGRVSVK